MYSSKKSINTFISVKVFNVNFFFFIIPYFELWGYRCLMTAAPTQYILLFCQIILIIFELSVSKDHVAKSVHGKLFKMLM